MGMRGESYLRDGLRVFGELRYRVICYRRGKETRCGYVFECYHSIVR